MAIRIPWDKYETAILLYFSEKVINEDLARSEAIMLVSQLLRRKALKHGINIDSTYRNENGISMQMNIMTALIEDKPYRLHKASKLFLEIVEMYKYKTEDFNLILKCAMEGENMLSEGTLLQIDFTDIHNISYTKPLQVVFYDTKYSDFSNWSQLYIRILSLLFEKHNEIVTSLSGKNISGNGRVEISSASEDMISPKKFAPYLFVETNISATDIIKKIRYLIDLCDIDYDDIKIYYQKKETTNSKSSDIISNIDIDFSNNYKNLFEEIIYNLICTWDKTIPFSIQDIKKKIENMPEISKNNKSLYFINDDLNALLTRFNSILEILKNEYGNGFKFDATSIRLLSNKAGCIIDDTTINTLKKVLFQRKDNIYFLEENITSKEIISEIINVSDNWLDSYGFFEVSVLYEKFLAEINQNIILDKEDFIHFYEFINNTRRTRCVESYHTKVIRVNNNMSLLSSELIKSLIHLIHEDFCGTIDEYSLQENFPAFSIDLLDRIIKENSDELLRTNINDMICYQTLDALGLPNDFSDKINKTLELIENINLTPTADVIHTTLSISLSCNFKKEYNIPDDKTFKKIVETYYNNTPIRKWIKGAFIEEQD